MSVTTWLQELVRPAEELALAAVDPAVKYAWQSIVGPLQQTVAAVGLPEAPMKMVSDAIELSLTTSLKGGITWVADSLAPSSPVASDATGTGAFANFAESAQMQAMQTQAGLGSAFAQQWLAAKVVMPAKVVDNLNTMMTGLDRYDAETGQAGIPAGFGGGAGGFVLPITGGQDFTCFEAKTPPLGSGASDSCINPRSVALIRAELKEIASIFGMSEAGTIKMLRKLSATLGSIDKFASLYDEQGAFVLA